jgi:hypothetical protein
MEDVRIFYGNFVYFTEIWYILRTSDIFYGNLVYFTDIWYILWWFGLVYFTEIWYILRTSDIFYGNLVYFVMILHIFSHFSVLYQLKCGNRFWDSNLSMARLVLWSVLVQGPRLSLFSKGWRAFPFQGPMLRFLKYFRRNILQKYWRFWLKTKLNYEKIDHNIGFREKRQFFSPKIAENCDHNIDPSF